MRIYPYFQDTGAFFIAVFQKTGPITDISSIDSLTSNKNTCETEDVSTVEVNDDIQNSYEEIYMSNEPDTIAVDDSSINDDILNSYEEEPDATAVDDSSINAAVDNFVVVPIKRHKLDAQAYNFVLNQHHLQ
ncbi:1459_t:CDS:2, partial [Scutellospora calospora]